MIRIKRLFRVIAPLICLFALPAAAYAYSATDLPDSMTFSEAVGIFESEDIQYMTVSDIDSGSYITISDSDDIYEFFDTVKNARVYRAINPTPFRGIVINMYMQDDVKTYCINSGVQIGLFGSGSYVCYKLDDRDTEDILFLQSMYWDSEERQNGETIHRNAKHDFLKLPRAQWAREFAGEAAEKNLLPYEFTGIYPKNISREQFCILLGNLIAVNENYRSLEDYMTYNGYSYRNDYFDDCESASSSINILYALGIVNGKGDTTFDPYGEITREEAATLLCKVAEKYMWIGTESTLAYNDAHIVSDWARFFVTWANENNVMTGITDTDFVPQGAYTVEQAIATMVRLFNLINNFH